MSVLHNRGSWRRRKKTTTEKAAAAPSPTIASVPKPVMLAVMSRSGSAPGDRERPDDDGVERDLDRAGHHRRPITAGPAQDGRQQAGAAEREEVARRGVVQREERGEQAHEQQQLHDVGEERAEVLVGDVEDERARAARRGIVHDALGLPPRRPRSPPRAR